MHTNAEKKIKILHTVSSAGLAGTERALLLLLDGSDRTRFEHTVALPEHGPLETELASRGIETHFILRGGPPAGYHAGLTALMLSIRPHILHIHYSRIDAITARILGIKTIERKNLTRDEWHKTPSRIAAYDRIAQSFIQIVITPSEFTRGYYIKRGVAKPDTTFTVYNGINFAPFDEPFDPAPVFEQLGIPPGCKLITSVGRLVPLKGMNDAVAAAPAIFHAVPNARLLIIGEGPEMKNLRRLAGETGAAEKIIFAGHRSDVHGILRSSAVFLHTSYTEALSNAVLEAMAARCPVVATDIPGNTEIVRHEHTGLLVPTKNPEAIAAAVTRLLTGPALAQELAGNARALIEKSFSTEKMARDTENLYMKLLSPTL